MKTTILTFTCAVALAVGLAHGGETLQGLSPREQWACIKAHPAVVNPVGRDPHDESVLSLRGEWDFCPTQQAILGNSPSGRELTKGDHGFWRERRKIQVPGCWEAQGVGTPAMGIPCFMQWDVMPKPLRHVHQGEG